MRGFAHRSTVETALAWVDAQLPVLGNLPVETVGIWEAAGRVLAAEAISEVAVPGFARSMMDGFALRSEETHGAGPYSPITFRVIGDCFPGRPFSRPVGTGEAVRIMTGAPLPDGADAVLPVEQTELQGTLMQALEAVTARKHVGVPGEDIRSGEVVLPAGRILRPQDVGLLSSIGRDRVDVVRRPRVRLIVTGNELLPAGTPPAGCRIADANGPLLSALARRDGADVQGGEILPDDPAVISEAFRDEADVFLVSGGSSVGQEDFVPKLLAEAGELGIHGIAMRPSSPTGIGRLGNRLVFLLPGNPVSCLCAYDFFAGRAIRALGGRSRDWPYRLARLPLARKLVSTVGRLDYARVQIQNGAAAPLAISGASILSSTTRADGFVVVPADCEGYPAGADVDLWLY